MVGAQTLGRRHGGPLALVSCRMDKSLAQASGGFSLGVKEGSLDLREEIRPGDWVTIYWTRNGVPLPGMLGRITNVQRARRSKDGATVEDWTISGRDFAHIFEKTTIWFDDFTNYETNAGGQILGQRMNFSPAGTPDQVVANIILAWLGAGDSPRGLLGGPWIWPQSLKGLGEFFADGLHISVADTEPVPIGVVEPLNAQGQAVHLRGELGDEMVLFSPNPGTVLQDILTEWSNPMLNELHYDILFDGTNGSSPQDPIPCVYLRERPFINASQGSKSPWFGLQKWIIPRDAVLTSNVTASDDERLNLFLPYVNGVGTSNHDQYVIYGPSYDRESMARYGLRKWEQSTRFSAILNGEGNMVQEIAEWHSLIVSWYAPNHEWLSGDISLPFLFPEARIGQRIQIGVEDDDDREQFYIEGTSLSWKFAEKAITQFAVTRGFRGGEGAAIDLVRTFRNRYRRRLRDPDLQEVVNNARARLTATATGEMPVK